MAETLDMSSMIPQRFEPKRKTRWVLAIEGIDAYLLKSAARPSLDMGEIEIPWINTRRYLTGTAKWDTMTIKLQDAIAPSAAQQVMEWVRLHHETVSGRTGYADFYKRDIQLKMLDPIGTVIELWNIKGAFITKANFGDLEYGNQDGVEIELVLRYDSANLSYLRPLRQRRPLTLPARGQVLRAVSFGALSAACRSGTGAKPVRVWSPADELERVQAQLREGRVRA